jgi:polyhydroxyalkanoate synthesis regulator phasin
MSTPMWRLAFDAVERPLAAASESWVQSDTFMDVAAVGFKVQRRMTGEARQAIESWLALWGVPTRSDLSSLINQVAGLERQVRRLAAQVEERT